MLQTDNFDNLYINCCYMLSGCGHIFDAYNLIKSYNITSETERTFITNLIKSKTYRNIIDIKTFNELLQDLKNMDDKWSCYTILNKIDDSRFDEIQNKTIQRIIGSKPDKNINKETELQNQKIIDDNETTKKCPHQGCENFVKVKNQQYVVCGYTDIQKGYDNIGCGRDWCFKCGKKLCKSWLVDKLFLQKNRVHNFKCCEAYALTHGDQYPEDFCVCIENNIIRSDNLLDDDPFETFIKLCNDSQRV